MREKWLGFYGGSQDSQRGYVDVISVSMDRMWVNCWGYVVLGFYGCSQDSQIGSGDNQCFDGCNNVGTLLGFYGYSEGSQIWLCGRHQCFDVCNNVGKIVGIPIMVVPRTHKMVL